MSIGAHTHAHTCTHTHATHTHTHTHTHTQATSISLKQSVCSLAVSQIHSETHMHAWSRDMHVLLHGVDVWSSQDLLSLSS